MHMLTLQFEPTDKITACQLARIIAVVGGNLQGYIVIKQEKWELMDRDLKQFFTGVTPRVSKIGHV